MQRFWDKVDKSPGHGPWGNCWLWTAGLRGGYGAFKLDGKTVDAHRLSYQIANKVILPTEICVCHRCDVRGCVNPDHLFEGTKAVNNADMWSKGRGPDMTVPRERKAEHGTVTRYSSPYKCRCELCKVAQSVRMKAYHLKRGRS